MCKVGILRELVKQRLSVAVEEIFELFEKTIADYEEELRRKEANERRQRELLDTLLMPQVRLHRADIQHMLVTSEEEVACDFEQQQQEQAEPPRIKPEEEDVWINYGLERTNISTFTMTDAPVKWEDDSVPIPSAVEPCRAGTSAPLSVMDNAMSSYADHTDDTKPANTSNKECQVETTQRNENKDWNSFPFGKMLAHEDGLKSHTVAPAGEGPFACSFCAKRFPKKEHMQRHMITHRFQIPFSCSVCGEVFASNYQLITHKKTHNVARAFSCTRCVKTFARKEDLRIHSRMQHTGERPFACPVCPKKYAANKCLAVHMRTHVWKSPLACPLCPKAQVEKHTREETSGSDRCCGQSASERPHCDHDYALATTAEADEAADLKSFSCYVQQVSVESQEEEPADPACFKEEEEDMWSRQDGEQLQVLEEEADVKTAGLTCLKSEEDRSRLSQSRPSRRQKHRGSRMTRGSKGEHTQAGNFAPLPDMDDMMSLSSDSDRSEHPKEPLKTHKNPKGDMMHHSGNKQFICTECGKMFVHRGTLNRHMRTHTGEKPFSCTVCARRFSTNSDIKIHMRTHTGEKPFACSFCPQRFPIKSNMKIHIRVKHTGEKPFICSICPQRFSRKSAMKLHVQVKHTGVKPFTCSLCPKRFSSNKNVMIHMRTHTGEKAFSCNVCAQRFSYKYQMDKHRCAVMEADAMSIRSNTLIS